uniref:Reverse transcriptase Ty1/copia-type domain-containing protein n=1 Tax=Cannabis sativa TaxID=3483 RepID=A0A803QCM5_CANSA
MEFLPLDEDAGENTVIVNLEFEAWTVHDHLLLGWLYGSMTESDLYLEKQLVSNSLSGLDIEYLPIVVQVEARPSTTWQELQDILLSCDSKVERLSALSSTNKNAPANYISPNANVATTKPGDPNNSGTGNKGNQGGVVAFIATPDMVEDIAWYADSGASNHVTAKANNVTQKAEYNGEEFLTVGNGNRLQIAHVGCGKLDLETKKVLLQGKFKDGLYQFADPKEGRCDHSTKSVNSSFVFTGLVSKSKSQHVAEQSFSSIKDKLHRRLGHPSNRVLSQVLSLADVKPTTNCNKNFCEACQFGKSHALPLTTNSERAKNMLDLIHSNVWGPTPILSNTNYRSGFLNTQQLEQTVKVSVPFWSAAFSPLSKTQNPTQASTSKQPTDFSLEKAPSSLIHSSPNDQDHGLTIDLVMPGTSSHTSKTSNCDLECTQNVERNTTHPILVVSTHPMITHAKAGIFKQKTYIGEAKWDCENAKPVTVEEALQHPRWTAAMDEENSVLKKSKTWVSVPRQSCMNVIGNKWVYKVKRNAAGTHQRYKACLVSKGFSQRPGIEFGETYSLVVKASTARIILSIAVAKSWEIRQLDINNAFLNGQLQETVYME